MFKLGDYVVWASSLDSIREPLQRGQLTKIRVNNDGTLLWVDGKHRPEDCLSADFVWPAAFADRLNAIRKTRAELKRAFDDSMKLIYDLRNEAVREAQ